MVRLLARFPTLFNPFPFGNPPGLRPFTKAQSFVVAALLNKGLDRAQAYDRLCDLQTMLYPGKVLPVEHPEYIFN